MFSKYIFVYRKIRLTWNSGWVHIRNLNVQGKESQNKEVVTVPQTSNKTQQIKREGVVKNNAEDSNMGQLSVPHYWSLGLQQVFVNLTWAAGSSATNCAESSGVFEQKQKCVLASEHLSESQRGGMSPQAPVLTRHRGQARNSTQHLIPKQPAGLTRCPLVHLLPFGRIRKA